jgi:hypothetical protein
LKVMIYLCEKHAKGLAPKSPMTDDVLICQVPVCFRLATWKYFADIPGKYNTRNPRSAQGGNYHPAGRISGYDVAHSAKRN